MRFVKMKIQLFRWTAALLVLFFAQTAMADADEKRHRCPKTGAPLAMLGKLDLTDAQKEALGEIRTASKAQMRESRAAIRDARRQLHAGLAGDTDADELRELHREIQAMRAEVHEQRFERLLEVREVLTPAQRAQLAEMSGGKHHKGRHHGKTCEGKKHKRHKKGY
jgi:periplasmic protein CpxP/Spy